MLLLVRRQKTIAIIGRLTNNNNPLYYLKISNFKFNNLTTATSF